MKHSSLAPTLLVLIITITFTLPTAASCPYPPCPVLYYHTFTTEPDYCDYSPGDGLFIRWSGTTATGWYLVPSTDLTTAPPVGFNAERYTIVQNTPYCTCCYSPF